jgi:hypothetical protein
VRTLYFFGVLAATASMTSIVACSPVHTAAATTTTAADVSSASPTVPEAAPAAETEAPAPAPPGQLVCRTKSVVDGTTEVFLEWNGSSAKGTLRREAPSGMVYVQRVQAERAASLIIVDEPSNEDLMSHAAVIGKQDGKTLMRLGGAGQPWTPCE